MSAVAVPRTRTSLSAPSAVLRGQRNTTYATLLRRFLDPPRANVTYPARWSPRLPSDAGRAEGNSGLPDERSCNTRGLFPDKSDVASYSLMFDEVDEITVTSLLKVCRLDAARLRPGHAIAPAMRDRNETTTIVMHNALPPSYSPEPCMHAAATGQHVSCIIRELGCLKA